VVVLEKYVYVYNFDKLERIRKYETCPNNKGLVALSPIDECVLAFPHTTKGVVRVELLDSDKSHLINAHDSNINCISLNFDGSRLATASEKGTLIRIFDTYTGAKLQEVRRGADRADIYSISFSPDSRFFCTSSDKGTIHIFALNNDTQNGSEPVVAPPVAERQSISSSSSGNGSSASSNSLLRKLSTNRKSKISFFGGYFSSEWSFSWFKGPECPSICCFGTDSASVTVFTAEGSYYKLSFDTDKGGECVRRSFSRFLKQSQN
jgi:WD40 repeat protein